MDGQRQAIPLATSSRLRIRAPSLHHPAALRCFSRQALLAAIMATVDATRPYTELAKSAGETPASRRFKRAAAQADKSNPARRVSAEFCCAESSDESVMLWKVQMLPLCRRPPLGCSSLSCVRLLREATGVYWSLHTPAVQANITKPGSPGRPDQVTCHNCRSHQNPLIPDSWLHLDPCCLLKTTIADE